MHIDMKLNFMHILANFRIWWSIPYILDQEGLACHKINILVNMHTWTYKNQMRYNLDKTPNKPRREHIKVWHKKVVQIISKSKSTHDWGKKQINMWMIPKHINTWSVISIGIKSNNTWEIRHQLKNKIPTRRQDTKKRIILDRNQVR